MENHAENVHQRLLPDPFLKPLYGRNSFKNRYFERGLSKSLKKVNFIFSFEPSPF